MTTETAVKVLPDKAPYAVYGLPFPEACSKGITALDCSKVYVILSGSLSRNSDALQRLESALGKDVVVGVRKGMKPHTLLSEVLETAAEIKAAGADCILTLGGGSLIDGAKIMALAITNGADNLEKLIPFMRSTMQYFPYGSRTPPSWQEKLKQTTIKLICVTTTLSGGEYTGVGGGFDEVSLEKVLSFDPSTGGPRLIVWDPTLTVTTPLRVWLSTGVRGIDHCVESLCSRSPIPSEAKAYAMDALKLLAPALLKTKSDSEDLEARLQAQKGGMGSIRTLIGFGIEIGASHGIGHQLGPFGVPHGETSCILMPAVAKYNKSVNGAQQEEVLNDVFWADSTISDVLTNHGLVQGKSDLGDALDAIFRELGMPRTLKELGIGRNKFAWIAENSLKDICTISNPRTISKPEDVMEILDAVAGE